MFPKMNLVCDKSWIWLDIIPLGAVVKLSYSDDD